MATLPYLSAPGNIDKTLNAIKNATVPQKVNQDFVKTILKIPGGSGDQMTSFIKKIGLANPDGSPNETYKRYRNPTYAGQSIAKCIKHAYAPLYIRNEYMHELTEEELIGLVTEETGNAHDSPAVRLIVNCIQRLKSFAKFEEEPSEDRTEVMTNDIIENDNKPQNAPLHTNAKSFGLNLGYTINLNLPATSDPAVFDAIFKSLKENLMSESDA